MGNVWNKTKPSRALMGGLDGAGKTTILYKWKLGEVVTSIPTIGFNVEEIELSNKVSIIAWDIGGRSQIRPLFRHYYQNTDVIIWVLDSSDNRLDQSRDELHRLLNEDELQGIPILVLFNKQDLLNAMSTEEAANGLGMSDVLRDRHSCAVGVSAITGEGLDEALKALEDILHLQRTEGAASKKIGILPPNAPAHPTYGVTKKEDNQTLQRFAVIQNSTECPFAKTAKLWGGSPVVEGSSLEDQAKAHSVAFTRFVYECKRNNAALDGFCLEVDHPRARNGGTSEFGECVRKLLTAISDLDPQKEFVMRVKYIGARGWRFRFGGIDFFVTSFAPCYPKTSSRYTFGANRAFLLLQPELSFALHDLPPDTTETNYDIPRTIRDKTRRAYKAAGRPYAIPSTTKYPPAEHIVKPIIDDGVTFLRWWEKSTTALQHAQ